MIGPWIFLVSSVLATDAEFETFKRSFRIDALAAGIEAETYDLEMLSAEPLEIVFERDSNQPEFVRPIWGYLDSAVSDRRVADGRKNYEANKDLLHMVGNSYGVDPTAIAAIWGLESNYGSILGTHDIISATATLAYKGRRQGFGRRELLAALEILQNDYAEREELVGSWAGAMGQTQFIPSTYLAYAIDYNDDGRRDLWKDAGDVFASTANYLDQSGWEKDQPTVIEVTLPQNFDYSAADGRKSKVVDWIRMGINGAQAALPDVVDLDSQAKLLIPAGANGPAFLTFKNFDVIKRYNNATSYALGVSLLSQRIGGAETSVKAPWPRDDRPLSKDERMELQNALAAKGYQPGPVDGIIGARTRKALRSWQKSQGLPADGYPSAQILGRLQGS